MIHAFILALKKGTMVVDWWCGLFGIVEQGVAFFFCKNSTQLLHAYFPQRLETHNVLIYGAPGGT